MAKLTAGAWLLFCGLCWLSAGLPPAQFQNSPIFLALIITFVIAFGTSVLALFGSRNRQPVNNSTSGDIAGNTSNVQLATALETSYQTQLAAYQSQLANQTQLLNYQLQMMQQMQRDSGETIRYLASLLGEERRELIHTALQLGAQLHYSSTGTPYAVFPQGETTSLNTVEADYWRVLAEPTK